jgi:hypothetical protein
MDLPRWEVVRDAMAVLFNLLEKETDECLASKSRSIDLTDSTHSQVLSPVNIYKVSPDCE